MDGGLVEYRLGDEAPGRGWLAVHVPIAVT